MGPEKIPCLKADFTEIFLRQKSDKRSKNNLQDTTPITRRLISFMFSLLCSYMHMVIIIL